MSGRSEDGPTCISVTSLRVCAQIIGARSVVPAVRAVAPAPSCLSAVRRDMRAEVVPSVISFSLLPPWCMGPGLICQAFRPVSNDPRAGRGSAAIDGLTYIDAISSIMLASTFPKGCLPSAGLRPQSRSGPGSCAAGRGLPGRPRREGAGLARMGGQDRDQQPGGNASCRAKIGA